MNITILLIKGFSGNQTIQISQGSEIVSRILAFLIGIQLTGITLLFIGVLGMVIWDFLDLQSFSEEVIKVLRKLGIFKE